MDQGNSKDPPPRSSYDDGRTDVRPAIIFRRQRGSPNRNDGSDTSSSVRKIPSSTSSLSAFSEVPTSLRSVGSQHGFIHEQLVRERDNRSDLNDIYEIVEPIGQGGLCTVYKIRKLDGQIGGSSRSINQRRTLSKRFYDLVMKGLKTLSEPLKPSTSYNEFYKIDFTCKIMEVKNESNSDFARAMASATTHREKTANPTMLFALKVINLKLVQKDKIDQLRNEVEILKGLDHPNIIRVFETFQSKVNKTLMIVMELCTGGDLRSRMPYTESQAAAVIKQIISAVRYMHARSIIHRDLKLENVVFESEQPTASVRVIDFGLSKEYSSIHNNHVSSERVGTLYCMSPETLKGNYSYKADLWSIGVCLFMLLSNGQQPFEGATSKQLISNILRGRYGGFNDSVWTNISDEAKDFLQKLLVVKVDCRLTADEAMHHPWIVSMTSCVEKISINEEFKQRIRKCILQYANYNDFMKLVMNVIAKKSTSEEVFELRRVFEEFDTLNTGTITLPEFKEVLHPFNFSESELEKIFHKIDINKDNEITYTEFLASTLLMQTQQGVIEEHRLGEAFDLIDRDDSGFISRENLLQMLGGSEKENEDFIDKVVGEIGIPRGSKIKISYDEFLNIFEREREKYV